MDLGIKGRSAVVFAASKGFGKATALALAAEGCRVAICSRDEKNIKETAEEIGKSTGTQVIYRVVDVAEEKQILSFIEHVAGKWGKIEILVNNAGGPPVKSFEETVDAEWHFWYDVTFMSVVRAVRAVLPHMKKNGFGRIINITSISVKAPVKNLIYSNALRMAVIGLAKSLSQELGAYGITVHNVAPGYHLTDGLERIIKKRMEQGETRDDILDGWIKTVPMGRIGEPDDLAALITFLASGKSGYLSGTTIACDGGMYPGTL
ncbi:MAG: SDR family oxidoreductase [Calditrichaceae bacterium]